MQKKFKCIPLDKIYFTQFFGESPEFYKKYLLKGHPGLDFRTKFKDTPLGYRDVYAVDDGVIEKVVIAEKGGYGTYIKIRHDDQSMTIYGHQLIIKGKEGQRVFAGDKIGLTGDTGDSTGPHLHLGYQPATIEKANGYNGYVDPYPFMPLPARADFVGCGASE